MTLDYDSIALKEWLTIRSTGSHRMAPGWLRPVRTEIMEGWAGPLEPLIAGLHHYDTEDMEVWIAKTRSTEHALWIWARSEPVRASVDLGLVPLSKIGTHLLASSDIIEKNRNSLACLRNAGPYFAESYCSSDFNSNAPPASE